MYPQRSPVTQKYAFIVRLKLPPAGDHPCGGSAAFGAPPNRSHPSGSIAKAAGAGRTSARLAGRHATLSSSTGTRS